MAVCRLCKFDTLKVPDLKTVYCGIYHVNVLKSKERIHDCIYSPKRIPESVRYSSNDMPTVPFLKADNVLKMRFYTICPPIQRKRLWNCSTTCANLGRKPATLIVGELTNVPCFLNDSGSSAAIMNSFHLIPSTCSIASSGTNHVVLDNFVMDLRYNFHVGLDSKGMAELMRFVDFNQTRVRFESVHDLISSYPLIFTPEVTTLVLVRNPRDFSRVWLPNLEFLSGNTWILAILIKEMIYFPKITSIQLSIDEQIFAIINYSMIATILRNQNSNLWLRLRCSCDLNLNDKSLLEHFVPVEEKMWNQKGLCFSTETQFAHFVLR